MVWKNPVRILRKHPLAIRALELLTQTGVLNLQTIANNLGVHKVSAHRVMRLLTDMKLVSVREGNDRRCRHFTIPNSKAPQVKRLIQTVKDAMEIPVGRALAHTTTLMGGLVQRGLESRGARVTITSQRPRHMFVCIGELVVGLRLEVFERPPFRKRFDEVVGNVITSDISTARATAHVLILIGPEDKELVEKAHDLEVWLKDVGIKLKFLWVTEDPLQIDSLTIEEKIVEPLVQLMGEWYNN